VFCSFLALVLRKALGDRLAAARVKGDLDRLQEIETEQEGKHFMLHTPVAVESDVSSRPHRAAAQYPRGRGGCDRRPPSPAETWC
jgi:hypothetical protein